MNKDQTPMDGLADELRRIASRLQFAYGDLPTDRFPGPLGDLGHRIVQIASEVEAARAQTAAEPGWRWVPEEPTQEMVRAIANAIPAGPYDFAAIAVYKAMLAAAPSSAPAPDMVPRSRLNAVDAELTEAKRELERVRNVARPYIEAAVSGAAPAPTAWYDPEGDRVLTASQIKAMVAGGGASASAAKPYTVPLCAAPAPGVDAPSMRDAVEELAQGFDGCTVDAVGGGIDVGEAIRAWAAKQDAIAALRGVSGDADGVTQTGSVEEAIRAARNSAFERAAEMCEQRACSSGDTGSPSAMARQCARDIRSQKHDARGVSRPDGEPK